jgi:hypothetical protein
MKVAGFAEPFVIECQPIRNFQSSAIALSASGGQGSAFGVAA